VQTGKQSILWRLYAVFMLLVPGLGNVIYIVQGKVGSWVNALSILVAVAGVAAWAFGLSPGKPLIWRAYAAWFTGRTCWFLAPVMRKVARLEELWVIDLATLVAFGVLCFALIKMSRAQVPSDAEPVAQGEPLPTARLAAMKRHHQT
jgi:hypothetical protein